jgi:cell division protein FtsQ
MSLDHTLPRTRTRGRRAPRAPGAPLRALRVPHLRRRILLAVVLVAAGLPAGWMWLRDSSFVRVTDVQVRGATSSAQPRIRDALDVAGREMTTLHVRERTLQDAVAGFPSVAALHVRTEFPHRLVVDVVERRPAAIVSSGGQQLAATGTGLLLRDVGAPSGLPEVALDAPPAGARIADARMLSALAVAAAAPAALRPRTTRIAYGPRGITAELRDGPPLVFGTAADAAAKWAAAARVLAEPSAAGATYLDLRITGRVAAGGLGPIAADTGPTAQTPAAGGPQTAIPTVTAEPSPDPQP